MAAKHSPLPCRSIEDRDRQRTDNRRQRAENREQRTDDGDRKNPGSSIQYRASNIQHPETANRRSDIGTRFSGLIETAEKISKTTADTHQKFLEFSDELTQGYSETFALQTKLLEHAINRSKASMTNSESRIQNSEFPIPPSDPSPAFSRKDCLEFATGSVARSTGIRICRG